MVAARMDSLSTACVPTELKQVLADEEIAEELPHPDDLIAYTRNVPKSGASRVHVVVWEYYVTRILPATHGQGARNFWAGVVDGGKPVGFEAAFSVTDEAYALAVMSAKLEWV